MLTNTNKAVDKNSKFLKWVICCWYALTLSAGVYFCYIGIDIFSSSIGIELPLSIQIFLPQVWATIIGCTCIFIGAFMFASSIKIIFFAKLE